MIDLSQLPDKALSIRQPWAWAIIHAGKDVENRNWSTKFRGPVCIHAAKGGVEADPDYRGHALRHRLKHGFEAAREQIKLAQYALCDQGQQNAVVPKNANTLLRGGIIGLAEIVDCVDASESPWFMGRYGFVLRNVRPVPFIPVKGALSFFNWKSRIVALEGGEA